MHHQLVFLFPANLFLRNLIVPESLSKDPVCFFTTKFAKVLTAFITPFTALNPKRKIPKIDSTKAFTIAATLKAPPLTMTPTMTSMIKEMIKPKA